jgi:hypothetical protein
MGPEVRHRSRRPLAGVAVALLLLGSLLAGQAAATESLWSCEEQQFVYELNRVRWDPTLAGLGPTLALPIAPLAVSPSLASAADIRAQEMAQFDYFAHQSPITGLWPNEIARRAGYPLPVFWPDEANNIESIHRGQPAVTLVLQSFMDSPDHRSHLLGVGWYATHREIGVGADLGDRLWDIMTATDGTGRAFLTGVAYADTNHNRHMDLGEGLHGVTITIGTRSTMTNTAGGWALPVTPGTYQVAASGGAFRGRAAAIVRVGAYSVTIDFRSGGLRPLVLAYDTCAGRNPTILGSNGPDQIQGTAGNDVIHGLGGADAIDGGGGHDIICGGTGDDSLTGGPGPDVLRGGGGEDNCTQADRYLGCELP